MSSDRATMLSTKPTDSSADHCAGEHVRWLKILLRVSSTSRNATMTYLDEAVIPEVGNNFIPYSGHCNPTYRGLRFNVVVQGVQGDIAMGF